MLVVHRDLGVSYRETDGRVHLEAIDADRDFFVHMGSVTHRIDPRSLVDTSFANQAVALLGRFS